MIAPYGLESADYCATCSLRKNGYFCQIETNALAAFDRVKFPSSYPSGAVLFVEGQAPRGIYMLCKGRVKLTMASIDGKTVIVRIVESGELIGLHSAISNQPYELTAETLEPCQVNFVRREDFLKLMRANAELCLSVVNQMGNYYRGACQQIRYLGLTHSATEKLARFLLKAAASGQETKQGIRFALNLTHEEIAQVVNVSRETVTRALTELRNKDLISEPDARKIRSGRPFPLCFSIPTDHLLHRALPHATQLAPHIFLKLL
jgi:CRP/FNR family transcriptional regulator, cyclic AMP receptor protein